MPSTRGDDGDGKTARQRDQELRRSRGEISCAECRRLKLRCDKKVPCSSCSRRGCQTICPNGTLAGGQGSRFVLADTSPLHSKLLALSARIRQLEDALAIAHSGSMRSGSPHPLLADELLAIKRGLDSPDGGDRARREGARAGEEPEVQLDRETLEAFGQLSLCEGGAERFLGLSSGIQNRMNISPQTAPQAPLPSPLLASLPPELAYLAQAWPFPPTVASPADVRVLISARLPPWERAAMLVDAYVTKLSWYFRPVGRSQLVEELLPAVYGQGSPAGGAEGGTTGGASPPAALVLVTGTCGLGAGFEGTSGHAQQQGAWAPSSATTSTSSSSAASPESGSGTSSDPQPQPPAESAQPQVDLHELALLLMVLAVGASGDLTQAPYNPEAEQYASLARVALAAQSIFDGASLATVQAVTLLGAYTVFSARGVSLEPAWLTFYVGYSIAASLGLHRDPARWKLEAKMTNRRRNVFWELFTINNWQSLSCGRPTLFCLHSNDVEFPEDDDATVDENGKVILGYWRWKHKFAKEVLAPATDRLSIASSIKYSDIMDIDRSLRDFLLEYPRRPRYDMLTGAAVEEDEVLQYTSSVVFMDIVSLYIHRNFFAKAVLDHPTNPLRSPYAPSFLSAYRSATTILKTVREQYEKHGALLHRLWPVWAHSLSAAVIIASVVTRGPESALAPSAFMELGLAVTLFEKAIAHPVVRQGLPILMRLREKAQQALYEHRTVLSTVVPIKREEDHQYDMAILQGRPRDVPSPHPSAQSPSKRSSMITSPSFSSPPSLTPTTGSTPLTATPPAMASQQSPGSSPHVDTGVASSSDFDAIMNAQIPQAVLATTSTYPTVPYGLPPDLLANLHPQMFDMVEQYQSSFGQLGTGTFQSAASLYSSTSAPPSLSVPGPSWQQVPIAPTQTQTSASNAKRGTGLTSLFNFSEPSAFYQPEAASSFDYASVLLGSDIAALQAPMDATMDDAWKQFVQDSGFRDPNIFEMS